ncbi:hypothetical protein DBZ36_04765 [Alginatibacterium sediminis]|uniref:DUF1295 domain-containing protein n=1 Tax=Alginatibacterium sediminis TaxID=2164068 RepID=A0A420EGH7_9ALTE|nr:methyltransferase [Alginatibacterium sediminis]RKF19773.1 hypothetical protein DBZ36_04765 [Alginatibacterium sediminis]
MNNSKSTIDLWQGQRLHYWALTLLLLIVYLLWAVLAKPYPYTFWIAVAFPVLHQVYVWFTWRIELRHSAISNSIGFKVYVVLFFLLFGGRFVSLFALAWMDSGSLMLPNTMVVILTSICALPGIYAMYSVQRYFGMLRASGADHFDPKYRNMPLVNQGIFRFTNNGMYKYAFLLFWAIALGFNSSAAMLVAAFSHAYIWIHYYATEKPDMDYLHTTSDL